MKLKKFIMATWELPQNIVGAICKIIFKGKEQMIYKDAKVHTWKIKWGSISLGRYIFIGNKEYGTPCAEETIKHEYGHTIQSKYLGWLYLLVIGIPSFVWANCFEGYRKKMGKSYYSFYTEKWADRLGGVEREEEC